MLFGPMPRPMSGNAQNNMAEEQRRRAVIEVEVQAMHEEDRWGPNLANSRLTAAHADRGCRCLVVVPSATSVSAATRKCSTR